MNYTTDTSNYEAERQPGSVPGGRGTVAEALLFRSTGRLTTLGAAAVLLLSAAGCGEHSGPVYYHWGSGSDGSTYIRDIRDGELSRTMGDIYNSAPGDTSVFHRVRDGDRLVIMMGNDLGTLPECPLEIEEWVIDVNGGNSDIRSGDYVPKVKRIDSIDPLVTVEWHKNQDAPSIR